MQNSFILQLCLLCFVHIYSSDELDAQYFETANVMSSDSSYVPSMMYTVDDIAWLAGYWVGDGLGGKVEELWSKPKNGKMLCAFRYDNAESFIFSRHTLQP